MMTPTREELLALAERLQTEGENARERWMCADDCFLMTEAAAALCQIAEAMETHVLVPKEPTIAMVEYGWNESRFEYAGAAFARACYRAMLAAAPQGKE